MKLSLSLQRSKRQPLCLTLIVSLMCSMVGLVKCDKENTKIPVCDDGMTGIQEDLEDYSCHGTKLVITYDFPAGYSNCTQHAQEPSHVCMSSPIVYNTTPPSSGAHRMIWPCYGEYDYVPPQRWIHSLEHGAIVFLYHPCTPDDQVTALRRLAKSCLWKHIITSYPHLDQQYPMALVSWGCVYRMSWVDVGTAETWIKTHALKTVESNVIQDGMYNYNLQYPAEIVSDAEDSTICPKHHLTTSTAATTPPKSTDDTTVSLHDEIPTPSSTNAIVSPSNSATESPDGKDDTVGNSTLTKTRSGYKVDGISVIGLTLITGTLAILLVCGMLCVLWRHNPPRKRNGRYKSFLPMSLRTDDGRIAIPTIGLPRSNKAEAEILIPDDEDDDEI